MNPDTIFFIVLAGVFILLHLEKNGKLGKNAAGAFFIASGIMLISPIPGPYDFVMYPVFSSVSKASLGTNIFRYFVLTILAGIGFIWLGLKMTGRSFSYVKRKIKRAL